MNAQLRNSQAGHKMEQKNFCCVTTNPNHHHRRQTWNWQRKADPDHHIPRGRLLRGGGHAACVRQPHEPRVLLVAVDVVLVASRPANDVPASGNEHVGNTFDSTVWPENFGHILCADKCGGQAGGRWSNGTRSKYVEDVPRQGLLPPGPPERLAKVTRALFFPGFHAPARALPSESSRLPLRDLGDRKDSLGFLHNPTTIAGNVVVTNKNHSLTVKKTRKKTNQKIFLPRRKEGNGCRRKRQRSRRQRRALLTNASKVLRLNSLVSLGDQ
jgi:hypothetical protein